MSLNLKYRKLLSNIFGILVFFNKYSLATILHIRHVDASVKHQLKNLTGLV